MKDALRNIVVAFAIIGVMVVGLGALNNYANAKAEFRCEQRHGTYYRAPLVQNSLCRIDK